MDSFTIVQEYSIIKKLLNYRNPDILVIVDLNLTTIRQRRISSSMIEYIRRHYYDENYC